MLFSVIDQFSKKKNAHIYPHDKYNNYDKLKIATYILDHKNYESAEWLDQVSRVIAQS